MITPPYLKRNDKVALVATAGIVKQDDVMLAVEKLKEIGLQVVLGEHLFSQHLIYAGTDEQRLQDFQKALDDNSIKAIFCARGGYGTVRIIDRINFTHFAAHPKWIIGFSDITVLHNHINRHFDIKTLHSAMPFNVSNDPNYDAIDSIRRALSGAPIEYPIPAHPLNRMGIAKGKIVGGNLSVMYGLLGSNSEVSTTGCILFIEDLGEYMHHLDRMLISLKRCGKLSKISGLIVGAFTNMKEGRYQYNLTPEELILDAVSSYKYPVCFNFPAGHISSNYALVMGQMAHLKVGDSVSLTPVQDIEL